MHPTREEIEGLARYLMGWKYEDGRAVEVALKAAAALLFLSQRLEEMERLYKSTSAQFVAMIDPVTPSAPLASVSPRAPMAPNIEEMAQARELLAQEYEVSNYGGGPHPSYAYLARRGEGEFTLCSIRAIAKALASSRAAQGIEARQGGDTGGGSVVDESPVAESDAPRYTQSERDAAFAKGAGMMREAAANEAAEWLHWHLADTIRSLPLPAVEPAGHGLKQTGETL